jgi:chromosome segregation ATPase
MKIKALIVILALACVGLGIALIATKQEAETRHASDSNSIGEFSNQVVNASEQIKQLGQVNLTLSNSLASAEQQLNSSAEVSAQLSNSLAAANTALADAKTSLVSAGEQVTNLNNRIADLEAQNRALDGQAESLSNQLSSLTAQIEDTRSRLAVSETNGAFLQQELQKQLAQRAELEHRFNDLDELRFQVKKIKDEMFMARRVQLMRSGLEVKKGGQVLMNHGAPPAHSPEANVRKVPSYDLNVEIGSDGSVRIIPPLGATNSPATNGAAAGSGH